MKEKPITFTTPMVRAILEGRKTQTRRIVKLPHENRLGVWEPTEFGGPNGGVTSSGETVPLQPALWHTRTGDQIACKYVPGDRLWVKETFAIETTEDYEGDPGILPPEGPYQWVDEERYRLIPRYRATAPDTQLMIRPSDEDEIGMKWTPSRFMPRWVSRITLEVTGVRAERLQDISEDDIFREGIQRLENHSWHAAGSIPLGTYRGLDEWTDKVNYWVDPRDAYKALWDSIHGHGAWEKNPWVWVVEFKRVEG